MPPVKPWASITRSMQVQPRSCAAWSSAGVRHNTRRLRVWRPCSADRSSEAAQNAPAERQRGLSFKIVPALQITTPAGNHHRSGADHLHARCCRIVTVIRRFPVFGGISGYLRGLCCRTVDLYFAAGLATAVAAAGLGFFRLFSNAIHSVNYLFKSGTSATIACVFLYDLRPGFLSRCPKGMNGIA